jgi:hypothetical protein
MAKQRTDVDKVPHAAAGGTDLVVCIEVERSEVKELALAINDCLVMCLERCSQSTMVFADGYVRLAVMQQQLILGMHV